MATYKGESVTILRPAMLDEAVLIRMTNGTEMIVPKVDVVEDNPAEIVTDPPAKPVKKKAKKTPAKNKKKAKAKKKAHR